ncbi:MAG: hypothetical protein JMDDDDMK_04446 [Acidobacteria bacterium]|nr:hypothetical protein [Acidobacteriota bacterium]
MNTALDHIAPEVAQAIIAQATARGLSVNDYLQELIGLSNGISEETQQPDEEKPQRNEAMLAALKRSAERLKDAPISGSTEQTLQIIREGRAGAMYGYEPTDPE